MLKMMESLVNLPSTRSSWVLRVQRRAAESAKPAASSIAKPARPVGDDRRYVMSLVWDNALQATWSLSAT